MTWGVSGLTVTFDGRVALEGTSLTVVPGEVVAVVGGDGAGKTTLLRTLAGIVLPTEGRAQAPRPRDVGYVPASGGVFGDLTVEENLEFAGQVHRVGEPRRRADPLLARAGLDHVRHRLARDLSGGMRRKLAVISAMLHDPRVLILDEPTTGVDPVSRADVWRLIAAAATAGAAVVVASAYLDEAERATSVLVLHEGRPLVSGTPDEVRSAMPGSVVDVAAPVDRSLAWRRGRGWRQWLPDGAGSSLEPTMEDMVIVASLADGRGLR